MRVLVAMTFSSFAFAPMAARAEADAFGKLTVDQVQQKLGEKNVFVFDNNKADTYTEGHVPGAKHVKPSELAASDLPADKSATLIFYCANEQCMACHDGAKAALKMGYKNVFIMPAGIQGWKKAGKTLEKA